MKITAEMKRAFRLAYDALENADEPEATDGYFTKTACALAQISMDNPDNPILEYLLGGIYQYLSDAAEEK